LLEKSLIGVLDQLFKNMFHLNYQYCHEGIETMTPDDTLAVSIVEKSTRQSQLLSKLYFYCNLWDTS